MSQAAVVLAQVGMLDECGRHAEALPLLAGALERWPQVAALHTAQGWALENLDPPAHVAARQAYQTALSLDPEDLWARLGLATIEAHIGDPAVAEELHALTESAARQRSTDEPACLEVAGWCSYRLGRLDEAAAAFEQALEFDPSSVAVLCDLGLVRFQQGDVGAAVHYERALSAIAEREPARRLGPLRLALDDLETAISESAAVRGWPPAMQMADRLRHAAAATKADRS